MHILFAFLSLAHAGWLSDLCSRFIIDDPYQFEAYSTDYVTRSLKPLEVRERWGTITPAESRMLEILRRELMKRQMIDETTNGSGR